MKVCSMPRFHSFDPDISSTQTELSLGGEESHHLVRVRRARVGDGVVVLNGQGLVMEGELLVADPRQALVRVTGIKEVSTERPLFKLAVGMPKGRTVDTVVRQATELGVAEIHFLVTDRSEVPAKVLGSVEKLTKWKRVSIEAFKQSENAFLPEINVGRTLQDWLQGFVELGTHFVACPERSGKICRFCELQDEQESVWLLAGPEGGLTEQELQITLKQGFQPVNLGTSILRVDTASVVLVALAQGYLRRA
jgi:16S rRNA (uracil1498-N3)-methyltransferase